LYYQPTGSVGGVRFVGRWAAWRIDKSIVMLLFVVHCTIQLQYDYMIWLMHHRCNWSCHSN